MIVGGAGLSLTRRMGRLTYVSKIPTVELPPWLDRLSSDAVRWSTTPEGSVMGVRLRPPPPTVKNNRTWDMEKVHFSSMDDR